MSFTCPVTNRKMYMDPEYEMATQYEEEQEYCRSILFESSFNHKRAAAPKASASGKKQKTKVTAEPVDLDAADVDKIDTTMKLLEAEIAIMGTELAEAEAMNEYISVGFINRVRKEKQDAHDKVDVAAMIIATRKTSESKHRIVQTLNATKKDVKLTIKDLKVRKAEALAEQQRKS